MVGKEQRGADAQRQLLDRWVASLSRLPAVDVIWLEGSLASDRATPWSDVDLRIALADEAYAALWEGDRTPLLEALGEYLFLWNRGFVRVVTAEGIVVELAAMGKHLQALSDQVGGGFEPEWYRRLYAKLERDLTQLIGGG